MVFQKTIPYIFAFTLFISATLVFSVQPMLGKMMLPHVGGAPSGWAVTMFFFQTCLLFGYGLAYIFSKLPPFLNILAILFVFLPAALFLPIAYQSGIEDSISPFAVFLRLTASTAVPFLALSTLAPGLQRIFSFSNHSTAKDPYYLYAASNLGSFVGLLAYPIILEPLIGLETQSQTWMIAFGGLFCCVIISAISIFSTKRDLITLKLKTAITSENTKIETITWARRFKWLCLTAIPSSLMIGTTTEITTDIASAPMIWVIPLSLYLLTNIIAFAKRRPINTINLSALHIISVIIIIVFALFEGFSENYNHYTIFIALTYIVAFTITALLLHGRLANDRPSTNKLTEFYLIMALGGAIGGSFNAFIAPTIFNDAYEFQLVFIISLILNPAFKQTLPNTLKKLSLGIILCTIVALGLTIPSESSLTTSLLFFLILISAVHAKTLFITSLITFLFFISPLSKKDIIHIDRNFFGVIKVFEQDLNKNDNFKIKAMSHGTTLHGFEAVDKKHAYKPYSYYSAAGPAGDVIKAQAPKDIVVLGLGVGQMACHKPKNLKFTFYEIDPHVVEIALNNFSVLEKCGYEDIIIGDARLELAKDKNKYDMVVVDTFSSDAIPIHLITSEAIELYMSKLKNNGVVLINISNRHLDLTKPLSAIAQNLNLIYRSKLHKQDKEQPYIFPSEWVVITKNEKTAKLLDNKNWINIKSTIRPWTDDYSNFISTIKFSDKNKHNNNLNKDNE